MPRSTGRLPDFERGRLFVCLHWGEALKALQGRPSVRRGQRYGQTALVALYGKARLTSFLAL